MAILLGGNTRIGTVKKRIESKFTPENYHLAFFLRFFLCCPLQYFSFVAPRSFITHQPSAKSNIHKEWPYCFNDSLCYALLLSRRVEGSFYHFWHFFYQSSYHYVYFYVVGTLKTGVFLSLVPRKELIKIVPTNTSLTVKSVLTLISCALWQMIFDISQ